VENIATRIVPRGDNCRDIAGFSRGNVRPMFSVFRIASARPGPDPRFGPFGTKVGCWLKGPLREGRGPSARLAELAVTGMPNDLRLVTLRQRELAGARRCAYIISASPCIAHERVNAADISLVHSGIAIINRLWGNLKRERFVEYAPVDRIGAKAGNGNARGASESRDDLLELSVTTWAIKIVYASLASEVSACDKRRDRLLSAANIERSRRKTGRRPSARARLHRRAMSIPGTYFTRRHRRNLLAEDRRILRIIPTGCRLIGRRRMNEREPGSRCNLQNSRSTRCVRRPRAIDR